MNFEKSEEERALQDVLERVLADAGASGEAGASATLWQTLAQVGLMSLPLPAAVGGLGGTPEQIMLAVQTLGGANAASAYLAGGLHAGAILAATRSTDPNDQRLQDLMSGHRRYAVACDVWSASAGRDHAPPVARNLAPGWELTGSAPDVWHGGAADVLIVEARVLQETGGEGLALFAVPTAHPAVRSDIDLLADGSTCADFRFDRLVLPEGALIAGPAQAVAARQQGREQATVGIIAETSGLLDRIQALTVEYLKLRRQFDRPIGNFQAVAHAAVDMLLAVEQARSASMLATSAMHLHDGAARTRSIADAQLVVRKASRFVSQQAIQLHGGIGMTEEYPLGRYARRLWVIDQMYEADRLEGDDRPPVDVFIAGSEAIDVYK